jgi:HK97 family phage prohead protease
MNQHERRAGRILELRAAPGAMPKITGYPAVFNSLSENLGHFRERVAPGAFKASIRADDIRALFNHDPMRVLGRNKAGTLTLREDAHGLAAEIDPPDIEWARDLVTSIERGDITGMSFGFDTLDDDWAVENGETVRTLRRVKLHDVSPVTFPAYPGTDVNVRSLESIAAEGRRRLGRAAISRPSGIALLRHRLEFEA